MRVQRVQKVQRVQRVVVSPLRGDEYKVSVTFLPSRPIVILSPGEESWYAGHMRHIVLNTRRREGAAGVKMKAIGFRLPATGRFQLEACGFISKNSIAMISSLRPLPPPLVPSAPPLPRCIGRATKGKRLYGQARRLTSPDLHILCRMCTVDNKAPYNIPFICGSKVSTCCCPTACGGEGGGEATKGGLLFPRPPGRLYGFL